MSATQEEIKKAIELGQAAWEREDMTEAVPGRDPDLMTLINNKGYFEQSKERWERSTTLMRAWLKGWKQAQQYASDFEE